MKRLLQIVISSLVIMCAWLIIPTITPAKAFTTNPKPTRQYVVDDYAHILNDQTKQQVLQTESYYRYRTATHPQIVMMTIPSTNGKSIDSYANTLLHNQRWHFGSKQYNNGTLILFAVNGGRNNVRISTGTGTQNYLSNSQCLSILENNESMLKSRDTADINSGLQDTFSDVSSIIDSSYAHLSKKQAQQQIIKQEHQAEMIKAIEILIPIVILIISIPPWNGHWFCGAKKAWPIILLLLGLLWWLLVHLPSGSNSGSDSGGGGSFSGGGASI